MQKDRAKKKKTWALEKRIWERRGNLRATKGGISVCEEETGGEIRTIRRPESESFYELDQQSRGGGEVGSVTSSPVKRSGAQST